MRERRRRRGARLEMTSLMDVMFLVLAFFIYCIFDMSVHRGVKVDLPSGPGADEKGERIVLTIDAHDAVQLNGLTLPTDEIVRRVKTLSTGPLKMPVLISGDRRASLGVGVRLLSELKAAGVDRVSFQVEKP